MKDPIHTPPILPFYRRGGIFLSIERRRNHKEKERVAPAIIQSIIVGLRSGMSLDEALKDVRESPLRDFFSGVDAGAPQREIIVAMFPEKSLAIVQATLLMMDETGGRGISALEMCAEELQNKITLRKKINALTAQARMSAWIVGLSPVGLYLLFGCVSPEFVAPLTTTAPGRIILAAAILLSIIGLVVARRVCAVMD